MQEEDLWKPSSINYIKQALALAQPMLQCGNAHPLSPVEDSSKLSSTKTASNAKSSTNPKAKAKAVVIDPLGAFQQSVSVGSGDDPLSNPFASSPSAVDPLSDALSHVNMNSSSSSSLYAKKASYSLEARAIELATERDRTRIAYSRFKDKILSEYKITGDIRLQLNAMSDVSGAAMGMIDKVSFNTSGDESNDKYKDRLRTLEQRTTKYEYIELSQKDYENHIEGLKERLERAWSCDERVQSLKLAIQMAKLLGDSTVPMYYPTIFVMVTNALEDFGRKVYGRLFKKCQDTIDKECAEANKASYDFPTQFSVSEVPQAAQEICRNWFYKASCIRDLVPRLYVEITLASCYSFLMDRSKYLNELDRLALQLRGLGEPIVCTYARAYLIHIGEQLIGRTPSTPCPEFSLQLMDDTCTLEANLQQDMEIRTRLEGMGLTLAKYRGLMVPAIDWILLSVATGATLELFRRTLLAYQCTMLDKASYSGGNATLLLSIINSFEGSLYSAQALEMALLAKNVNMENSPTSSLMIFSSLVKKMTLFPPQEDDKRNKFLNQTWRVAMASSDEQLIDFTICSAAVLEMIQRHYKGHEIPKILSDIAARIDGKEDKIPESVVREFEILLVGLFSDATSSTAVHRVLTSEALLKLLDVFRGPKRVSVCQQILQALKTMPRTDDPILIATIFDIARTIHDNIDRLTAEVDRNYSAGLISNFIMKVDFGNDLEQQLSTYTECRSAFSNLDDVKEKLCICVCNLAMKANAHVRGKHSRKTTAFVKACVAFCHITIPSIAIAITKLELTIHTAQVALQCQCLPQTDALLRATAKLISEVPSHITDSTTGRRTSTTDALVTCVQKLLSFLVCVPGNPEFGPFYIVNMLLRELPRYPWPDSSIHRAKVFMDIFALLCTYAQDQHPYHIKYIESNDVLYNGLEEYPKELNKRIHQCMQAIEEQLAFMDNAEPTIQVNQARMILDLINHIGARIQISEHVAIYLVKLMRKADMRKNLMTRSDLRYFQNTLEYIRKVGKSSGDAGMKLLKGLGTGN
jgi:hypothetical protein